MAGTAIIGLGMMGQGMARNIMAAGIPLRGFDLSPEARTKFTEAGGHDRGQCNGRCRRLRSAPGHGGHRRTGRGRAV